VAPPQLESSAYEQLFVQSSNSYSLMISDSHTRDREMGLKPLLILPENPTEDKAILNLVESIPIKRAPIITIVTPPK